MTAALEEELLLLALSPTTACDAASPGGSWNCSGFQRPALQRVAGFARRPRRQGNILCAESVGLFRLVDLGRLL